jgi:phosphonate metabolism protein PhnN/1,5-bisphosphokinase (PRPP-forming)
VSGIFVCVVGPSGVGKDSLIAAARDRLVDTPGVMFVRRVITRPEGGNEDHDTVDPAGFARLREAGAFVLSWGAHGLYYGIPASALEEVRSGAVVVANLSRGALTDARAAFPAVRIVNVTAPTPVLAARLARRGRETRTDIETRLARASPSVTAGPDVVTIDNGGALDDAVAPLVRLLEDLAGVRVAGQ